MIYISLAFLSIISGSIYLVLATIFLLTGINFVIANMIIKRDESGRYNAMVDNEQDDHEGEREEGDRSHGPNLIRS